MSESKNVKGTSIAAFMFLPQFHLCFRGFSHIVPIFMRTLALMFAQSGLIPNNHPATRYGIEGVKKYSLFQLIGEAWYTLRTTNATVNQWGLFSSIVMMIVMCVAVAGTFIATIFFGMGSAAQAQIFSHPGDPYGSGETNINAGTSVINNGAVGGAMFDKRTAYDGAAAVAGNANASQDLALMVLDKILRQSAAPGASGALQDALPALMEVYNTGVLVVAAVIIFWMILSIVVDTAKTGIVGGGRHNMVWTPIRVVFALGIMIPLGTSGYSSGQFGVMKLAEWGSNLGTRGWVEYVNAVVNTSSILSPFKPESASALAQGLTKLKVCQVAYNSYVAQSTVPDPRFLIQPSAPTRNFVRGTLERFYTNRTGGNLCGSVEYANPLMAEAVAWDRGNAVSAFVAGGIGAAAANFEAAMKAALAADIADGGALVTPANEFGCAFVARRMPHEAAEPNPVLASGNCGAATGCGSSATADPTFQCHQTIIDTALARLNNTYCGAADCTAATGGGALDQLVNFITGPMIDEMRQRGWAGMGTWTHYINVLNSLSESAEKFSVTIHPGSVWAIDPANPGASVPEIERKVAEVVTDYNRWWAATVTDPAMNAATVNTATRNANVDPARFDFTGEEGADKIGNMVKNASSPSGFADGVMSKVMPDPGGLFIFDILESGDRTVYPLTELVATGRVIFGFYMAAITALTLIQALSTISGFGFSAGTGLAVSALAKLIGATASIGLLCGAILAFYVPIIPLLRVAFAVLTWSVSVFEAVMMVPIAALAHLSSEGEGLAGGARNVWILWLNVLLRPVLVVIGFVGSMLVFNTFIVYFHTAFGHGASALSTDMNMFTKFFAYVIFSVVYVGVMYTAANSTFKLLDIIPDAMVRWMGGSPDKSFDGDGGSEAMIFAGSRMIGPMKFGVPTKPPATPPSLTKTP